MYQDFSLMYYIQDSINIVFLLIILLYIRFQFSPFTKLLTHLPCCHATYAHLNVFSQNLTEMTNLTNSNF